MTRPPAIRRRARLVGGLGLLALGWSATPSGQASTLSDVLQRAATYVDAYRHDLGSVIAEERYDQVSGRQHRRTIADLLLYSTPGSAGPWIAFRDVIEVDGTPVEDRRERFEAIFRDPSSMTPDLWQTLVGESARYNIGGVARNANLPTMALQVLASTDQPRFRFERAAETDGDGGLGGNDIWAVDFREVDPPVLVMGANGRELFATGTVWIEPATGRVLQTRLRADDPAIDLKTSFTVRYADDARLGMLVPVRMTERYAFLEAIRTRGRVPRTVRQVTIECEAAYSNFRRFEVEATVSVVPPAR